MTSKSIYWLINYACNRFITFFSLNIWLTNSWNTIIRIDGKPLTGSKQSHFLAYSWCLTVFFSSFALIRSVWTHFLHVMTEILHASFEGYRSEYANYFFSSRWCALLIFKANRIKPTKRELLFVMRYNYLPKCNKLWKKFCILLWSKFFLYCYILSALVHYCHNGQVLIIMMMWQPFQSVCAWKFCVRKHFQWSASWLHAVLQIVFWKFSSSLPSSLHWIIWANQN